MYIATILGMHLLLAAGFMLYFFHGSSKALNANLMEHVATTMHAGDIGNDAIHRNSSG